MNESLYECIQANVHICIYAYAHMWVRAFPFLSVMDTMISQDAEESSFEVCSFILSPVESLPGYSP